VGYDISLGLVNLLRFDAGISRAEVQHDEGAYAQFAPCNLRLTGYIDGKYVGTIFDAVKSFEDGKKDEFIYSKQAGIYSQGDPNKGNEGEGGNDGSGDQNKQAGLAQPITLVKSLR